MSRTRITHAAVAGLLLAACGAAALCRADDRLIVSGNGSTLDVASGGGGGAATYLHDFNPNATLGAGAEYQTLANAHWTFGTLTGSFSGGSPQATRWNVYAEAHEGGGDIGDKRFDYSIIAAGASGTFGGKFTIQGESRQFDVDTTHGNLPKLGIQWLVTRQLLLSASYAYSFGGNLDTEITTARIDGYLPHASVFIGFAGGHAAPAVINIQTGALGPSPRLREGFIGATKAFRRVEWSVIGDYLDLAGVRRITLTVIGTFHLGATRPAT